MTTWWGWAIRRTRASTGLLLTLLVLVTATTAILAGTVGYSGAAATTAARASLTGAVPQEAGIRVQTRQAQDPQAQDAAARRLVDEAFAPAPVSVQRTVVSEPRPVRLGEDGLEGRLVVLASASLTPEDPEVEDRVEVVEGTWPSPGAEPVQGMLHAAAAETWGVRVGDTLVVGGADVEVTGLWHPVAADDAFWFGDPLVAAGRDGTDRGPLIVPPDGVVRVVDAPFVRWTVQPDATRIQPDDLAHLASAAGSLRSSMKTPEVDVRGVTVDGDLAPTAGTAATNLATARALGVVPLSVLVLVTMLSVVQLARLLATTRETQHQLLLARGATGARCWAAPWRSPPSSRWPAPPSAAGRPGPSCRPSPPGTASGPRWCGSRCSPAPRSSRSSSPSQGSRCAGSPRGAGPTCPGAPAPRRRWPPWCWSSARRAWPGGSCDGTARRW
ncbi:hypothetical protein [Ornithinimicrobium sp. CNJ-824]|uniref:hypothetical protein n=1 Tax=Ornithinimicrobium sp. CNJ-824 TaxID=1904966 RepID=UPI003158189C